MLTLSSSCLVEFDSTCLHIEAFTERLFIRSYSNEDFDQSLSLYGDKKITKYFDHGKPRSDKEIFDYIQKRGRWFFNQNQPFGIFSVFLKENGAFIGQVDLVPTGISGEVEIGWIFYERFHNKGYCSEVVLEFLLPLINKIIEMGFKTNGTLVQRIIATAHPENIASIRVIQKAGLTKYQFKLRYQDNPRNWYACSAPIKLKQIRRS